MGLSEEGMGKTNDRKRQTERGGIVREEERGVIQGNIIEYIMIAVKNRIH